MRKIKPMIVAEKPVAAVAPIKIVIVEDDAEIRATLADVLGRAADLRLLETFPNGESAVVEIPRLQPDVVLMDINLVKMSGLDCVAKLKPQLPQTQFIMLTVYEDSERIFKALTVGAAGYLVKRTPPQKIIEAIHEVYEGGSPMTPQIARRVVQHFRHAPQTSPELEKLSPREKEILDQLSKGYLYKEIVDNLGISLDTVRTYIRGIYTKLHVHSRTEAVLKYLKR